MTQVDIEVVLRKLKKIKRYLSQLQNKVQLSKDAFTADFEQQLIVERLLHLLIEAAVDINAHILARNNQPPADTYRDSFIKLGEIGIISPQLAKQLAPAAGLRNRLVHDYDDIDVTVVYQAIPFALELLPQYVESVQAYLEKVSA